MRRKSTIELSILLLILIGFSKPIFAQISEGGLPYTSQVELSNPELPIVELTPPDLSQEISEIKQGIGTNRVAKHINIKLNLDNSGIWTDLPNGDRIWRLKIHVPDAVGLYMIYEEFELSENAKLFIYNHKKRNILGAFTNKNNKDGGEFITSYTRGSTSILELYEPVGANSKLKIKQIGYMYNTIPSHTTNRAFGDAAFCIKNINCPEGIDWQDEKKSVVRILFTYPGASAWCTGTLMNNTAYDSKPYVLTAFHCQNGGSLPINLNHSIFYFNYESNTCTTPSTEPNNTQTMVGAVERDKWQDTDYYLLELNNTVPSVYTPYFAGWDKGCYLGGLGTTIAHPAGDIKKIIKGPIISSASSITDTIATYHGFTYLGINFWHLAYDDGHIEPAADGSALFNYNKQVVGQLFGGEVGNCSSGSNGYGYYGKLSESWDNGSGGGLSVWLDPISSGVDCLPGYDGITIPPATPTSLDNELNNKIQVYPNPASEKLTIHFEEINASKVNLSFYNAIGRKMKRIAIENQSNTIEIDVQDLAKGMYLLKIQLENNQIINKKILIN